MDIVETTEAEDVCRYFDVENGPQGIRNAKVHRNVKRGDIINVYRGTSTKNGIEWKGSLEESLKTATYLGSHN